MSTDKEKKLKNNEIDIENENISGGCRGPHPGRGFGHRHGTGIGPMRGKWVFIPDDQGMMPKPPPNFEQHNPMAPNPEQNSVIPKSSDPASTPESSTPAQ